MNTNKLVGIILIVIGICAFAYQGITIKTQKKDVDIGALQISHTERHTLPLPPIVGGVALAGGIVLLIMGTRKP